MFEVTTTSFQALIEAQVSNYTIYFSSQTAEHQNMTFHAASRYAKFRLPWKSCISISQAFCVIQAKGFASLGINATIMTLEYDGPSAIGDQCLYGGIILLDRSPSASYIQLLLECDNIDDQNFLESYNIKAPTIFSLLGSNEMWIALYSYKQYSEISGLISISATDCKTIPWAPVKHRCLSKITSDGYPFL